jgi:chromosome segregation ATPase
MKAKSTADHDNLTRLNEMLVEEEAKVKNGNMEITAMKQRLVTINNELSSMRSKVEQLEFSLGESKTEADSLRLEAKVTTEEWNSARARYHDIEAQLRREVATKQTLNDELVQERNEVARLTNEVKLLGDNNRKLQHQVSEYKGAASQLANNQDSIHASYLKECEKVSKLARTCEDQEQQVASGKEQLTKAFASIREHELVINQLSSELEAAKVRITSITNELDASKSREAETGTQFEEAYARKQEEVKVAHDNINELKNEVKIMNESLTLTSSKLSSLTSEHTAMTSLLADTDTKVANLTNELDGLIKERDGLTETIVGLRSDITAASDEHTRLSQQLVSMTEDAKNKGELAQAWEDKAKEIHEAATTQVNELKGEITTLTSKLEILGEEHKNVTQHATELDAKVMTLNEQITNVTNERDQLLASLSEANSSIANGDMERASLSEQLTVVAAERNQHAADLQVAAEEQFKLTEQLVGMTEDAKTKGELAQAWEEKAKEIHEAASKQVDEHVTTITTLQGQVKTLSDELTGVIGERDQLLVSFNEAKAVITNGDMERASLSEQLTTVATERNQYVADLQVAAEEQFKLNESLVNMTEEAKTKGEDVHRLGHLCEEQAQQITSGKEQLATSIREHELVINQLSSDLESAKVRITSLSGDLEASKSREGEIGTQAADHLATIATLTSQMHDLQSSLTMTSTELKASNDSFSTSSSQLASLTEKYASLKTVLAETDVKVVNLTHEVAKVMKERDQLSSSLNEAKLNIAASGQDHARLMDEMNRLRNESNEHRQKSDEQIISANAIVKRLTSEVNTKAKIITQLEVGQTHAEQQIQGMNGTITQLNENITSLTNQLTSLTNEVAAVRATSTAAEVKSTRDKELLKARYTKVSTVNKATNQQLNDVTNEMSRLKDQLYIANTQIGDKDKEIMRLYGLCKTSAQVGLMPSSTLATLRASKPNVAVSSTTSTSSSSVVKVVLPVISSSGVAVDVGKENMPVNTATAASATTSAPTRGLSSLLARK